MLKFMIYEQLGYVGMLARVMQLRRFVKYIISTLSLKVLSERKLKEIHLNYVSEKNRLHMKQKFKQADLNLWLYFVDKCFALLF